MSEIKVLTYNVNGIRAAIKKDLAKWLKAADPDMVCIQETKAQIDQFDPSLFEDLGYHLHFESAEKKGYSGVAVFSKVKPELVLNGMGIFEYDREGRFLRCQFEQFDLISVYMPSGASSPERQDFKLQFLEDFQKYFKDENRNFIICGDFNLCHQAIDIHNPIRLDGYPGFTETERQWMSDFLDMGFTDTFRHLNKEPHHYSWWSYRAGARQKNLGWRIDYIVCSDGLTPYLKNARMLDQAKHSDHCPVLSIFDFPSN